MTNPSVDSAARATSVERARYKDLLEFAPVALLTTDPAGSIVEANGKAAGMLGTVAGRLLGKPITTFVPLEHRRQFRKTLLGLSRMSSVAEWELELEGRDGRRFPALVVAARALGGGFRWMLQDVSERDETEHRLRVLASVLEERVLERTDELEQERARLAAIVEQMPGGLVIASAPSGKIIVVNEHARTMLGIADGEPLHGIRGDAFRPDGSKYELEDFPLARALEGETTVGESLRMVGPDGEHFVLSVHAAPVTDRSGRITAAVTLLEDITVREQRDRAEREFVTNAAHELQSPLAAITSAVEVLQAGAKESADRDLFIHHIERETQRLDRLTRALLTLARAQVDVEAPRSEVIDLCPLLETVTARIEPAEGVVLSIECPDDLALVTNRELLEQTVSNVVRNAVKYTEEGKIRVVGARRGDQVVIAVVDTGTGIPKEVLPRVAERFYRGQSTGDGFGLGLSIVRAAMDVLGGELEIASTVGYGTTVSMTLPTGASRVKP